MQSIGFTRVGQKYTQRNFAVDLTQLNQEVKIETVLLTGLQLGLWLYGDVLMVIDIANNRQFTRQPLSYTRVRHNVDGLATKLALFPKNLLSGPIREALHDRVDEFGLEPLPEGSYYPNGRDTALTVEFLTWPCDPTVDDRPMVADIDGFVDAVTYGLVETAPGSVESAFARMVIADRSDDLFRERELPPSAHVFDASQIDSGWQQFPNASAIDVSVSHMDFGSMLELVQRYSRYDGGMRVVIHAVPYHKNRRKPFIVEASPGIVRYLFVFLCKAIESIKPATRAFRILAPRVEYVLALANRFDVSDELLIAHGAYLSRLFEFLIGYCNDRDYAWPVTETMDYRLRTILV
jgi:hypothetical protein